MYVHCQCFSIRNPSIVYFSAGSRALGHSGTRALGHFGTSALGHSGTRALEHSGTTLHIVSAAARAWLNSTSGLAVSAAILASPLLPPHELLMRALLALRG